MVVAVGVEQELDRAGVDVADRAGEGDGVRWTLSADDRADDDDQEEEDNDEEEDNGEKEEAETAPKPKSGKRRAK